MKKLHNIFLTGCTLLFLSGVFSGCSFRPTRSFAASVDNPAYRPPTLVPTPLPTVPATPTMSSKELETQDDCIDILRYIEDITIPDGTVISPGAAMDKRWRVENNGTCNWQNGYTLDLVAGFELGAAAQQALYPARSGSQVIIRMLFTAPIEPGTYRSAWQAHNAAGQPFGDPIYIEVIVAEPTSEAPVAEPSAVTPEIPAAEPTPES